MFCVRSSNSVRAGQQAPAAHFCSAWSGRQDLRLFPVSAEVLFSDRTTGKTPFVESLCTVSGKVVKLCCSDMLPQVVVSGLCAKGDPLYLSEVIF